MLTTRLTPLEIDILFGIIGLTVGSFLNLLAVRTLKAQSIFNPPSRCPVCQHRLGMSELLPVISYFSLRGKCKHCQCTIPWHYPFVEAFTAVCFIFLIRSFGAGWYGLGMLVFASTLIAICITDFKEKLIPHEITYPAILIGIIFSVNVRHDFWSTLAGIGISYIFIDFMAFYGLKVYLWFHQPSAQMADERPVSLDPIGQRLIVKRPAIRQKFSRLFSFEPRIFPPKSAGAKTSETHSSTSTGIEHVPVEDLEVIGGGDAVLSALIAAWLGLNRLILALIVSFLIGTIMGAAYLVYDMYKAKELSSLVRPIFIGIGSIVAVMMLFLTALASVTRQSFFQTPWYILLPAAIVCGSLFGIIWVGGRFSKPFPFGPALAFGAAVAMFNDPLSRVQP